MWNFKRQTLLFICSAILIIPIGVNLSCTAGDCQEEDLHCQVRHIAEPYIFDYVSWEAEAISSLIGNKLSGQDEMAPEAELRRQIEIVLGENDINVFPPLNFNLEQPPHLLVLSPRERIMYQDRVLIRQEISIEEMEALEKQIDELGLSSLVESLGGFGATYPPMVTDNASLTFTINAVVEEWLHQYLAFRPLGFRYLIDSIGIRQDPDVIVLNETLAGMVSEEIGSVVYHRYYDGKDKMTDDQNIPDFDFDAEMRETRRNVDIYLSQGEIEVAEDYMESRRQLFVQHGYNIRKLNQAYFAFHGIYGSDPASVSPINEDLECLRSRSPTLQDFLAETSAMTGYDDLKEALGE